jgi:hypothetical protein
METLQTQIEQCDAVAVLMLKKKELLRSLQQIDSELAKMQAGIGVAIPSDMAIGTHPTKGKRSKNELSLANTILLTVSKFPEGISRSEITEQLLRNGWKSNSGDFARLVGATISTLKTRKRLLESEDKKFFLIPADKE